MANKIDVEKLRALGVPEEVIASMDPEDGGNIDPNGNVLFLDEDRQKRKARPDLPLRQNKTDPEIEAAALEMSKTNSRPDYDAEPFFSGLIAGSNAPVGSPDYLNSLGMMGFLEGGHTGGTVMPLNVDLSETTQSKVLPVDLALEAVEYVDYIAILHTCVCRRSFKCQDYPIDLGCIFFNSAGRRVVELGIAREATVEEAKAHILKAKDAGLFCNVEMVEGEQFVWGLKNDEMNEFKMMCFCCTCCCLAMRMVKGAGDREVKRRYQSCGYTAVVDHSKCVGCQKCLKASKCPMNCITYREDGKCRIDQEMCLGCGFCTYVCDSGALSVKQTFPMRETFNDYFIEELRIDDIITAKNIAERRHG